jgi:glycine dehydrogenase subunit 1
MGPAGMRGVAELCLQKARYAQQRLTAAEPVAPAFDRPTFKEFVVRVDSGDVAGLVQRALDEGIMAGIPLRQWYPELADCLLVAVTEKRTKEDIDRLAGCLSRVC